MRKDWNKKKKWINNENEEKNDDINKVEWINYFNEGLIVESINNKINNSYNTNKISNLNNNKK